jgi:hypothetical protein
MNPAFSMYEGDYCFLLPAGDPGQARSDQEKKMKARSETTNKTKGNGPGRHTRGANKSIQSSSAGYDCPREQMIAEAAYFRAEQRGFVPGHEMSDWLQAEADVDSLVGPRD